MTRDPRWLVRGTHRSDGLNLVENCLDSLGSAADYLIPDQRDTKTAILWAVAGAEQLIKSLLASEHWTLVVQNTQDIKHNTREQYLQGEVFTVGFEEGLRRLGHCTEVEVSDATKNCLLELYRLRNRLAHFDQPADMEPTVELLKSALQQSTELYLVYLHDRVGVMPPAGDGNPHNAAARAAQQQLWARQEEWVKRSLLMVTPETENRLLKRLFDALLPLLPPSRSDRAFRNRKDLTLLDHQCFLCGQKAMQYLASSARCSNCNAFGSLDLMLRKVFVPRNGYAEAVLYEPYPTHPRHKCKKCAAPVIESHVGPGVDRCECIRCDWSVYLCMECCKHPDDCECCVECGNRRASDRCQGKPEDCPRNRVDPAGS